MATQRMTVNITGMTSAGGVARIEQALRQQDGVIWATINFAASQATLTCDPTTFRLAKLSDTVKELGYDLQATAGPDSPSALPGNWQSGRSAKPRRSAAVNGLAVVGSIGMLVMGLAIAGAIGGEYRELIILLGLAASLLSIGLILRAVRQMRDPKPRESDEPATEEVQPKTSRREAIGG